MNNGRPGPLATPIELVIHLGSEMGEVKVDLRQFNYLLQALVSNAVDAMLQGGRLTLTTQTVSLGAVEAAWYDLTPGDYALLTVQDTGIGLTDQVKAHLFEPFFTTKMVCCNCQAKTATTQIEAITAKRFVKARHKTMSEIEKRTRIWLKVCQRQQK